MVKVLCNIEWRKKWFVYSSKAITVRTDARGSYWGDKLGSLFALLNSSPDFFAGRTMTQIKDEPWINFLYSSVGIFLSHDSSISTFHNLQLNNFTSVFWGPVCINWSFYNGLKMRIMWNDVESACSILKF